MNLRNEGRSFIVPGEFTEALLNAFSLLVIVTSVLGSLVGSVKGRRRAPGFTQFF